MMPAAIASPLPPRFAEDSSSETKVPKGQKDGQKPKKGKSGKSQKDDDCEQEKTKDEETETSDPERTFEGHGHDEDDDEPDAPNAGSRKKPAAKGSRASTSRKKPAAGVSAGMKRPASSQKKVKNTCEDLGEAGPEHLKYQGVLFVFRYSFLGRGHLNFHHQKNMLDLVLKMFKGHPNTFLGQEVHEEPERLPFQHLIEDKDQNKPQSLVAISQDVVLVHNNIETHFQL